MTLVSSAAIRGRCPICGQAHATCGGPSSSVPVDSNVVEVQPMGQRGKYQDKDGNVFNVTPEHAEKIGLTPAGEPRVVHSDAADATEPEAEPKEKAVKQSANKAADKAEDK